jgi:hypothetical protein
MRRKTAFLLAYLMLTLASGFAADKMTPEQLISKHLDSIGSPEIRAKMNAIAVFGKNSLDGLSTEAGHIEGTAKLVSEGERFQFIGEFKSQYYEGEHRLEW